MAEYHVFPKYDVKLSLPKEVYFPSDDSFLMLDNIELPSNSKIVMEIGGGSGIISIYLAKKHPEVYFIVTDISYQATETILLNHKLNNLCNPFAIICANKLQSFHKVSPDVIIWNPPYLPSDASSDALPAIEKNLFVGGKKGSEEAYDLIAKISESNIATVFYTIFSSLGWNKFLVSQLENESCRAEIVKETKLFFEELYLVRIIFGDKNVK